MLSVQLISHTPNPDSLAAAAARICYSNAGAREIMEKGGKESDDKFLKMLLDLGHDSPLEHASFTFAIEGVSRSLLAQITRHRIASFSVKSQRYVSESAFTYITPPEIEGNDSALDLFNKAMSESLKSYNALCDLLQKEHYERLTAEGKDSDRARREAQKQAMEDARYVLPNACETKLVITMNARSLLNFFHLRLCERAQWEIRALAERMLYLVREVSPGIFSKAGPPCAFGKCSEGEMTCGKQVEKRRIYGGGNI